jgi:hypothetical protein
MSKFSCFIFGNPTNKTVTGTAYTWELLIANHLDQSLWSTNQKYWAAFRSNLVHSFLEVHTCVATFTGHGKLHKFGAEKPISWAKRAHFDFFTIKCTVWSHILSTGGDALTLHLHKLWNHITMEGTFTYCKANTPTKSKECTSPTLSKHYHWSQMISNMIQKISTLKGSLYLLLLNLP